MTNLEHNFPPAHHETPDDDELPSRVQIGTAALKAMYASLKHIYAARGITPDTEQQDQ